MAEERTQNLGVLRSMFPTVDPEVCEAVFDTNGGKLEESINALLSMVDPDYQAEEAVPVQTITGHVTSTSREQIQRDEELARTLAMEADREARYYEQSVRAQRQQTNQEKEQQSNQGDFFADELPVIKEKIATAAHTAADTTKKKVKEWYEKFKSSVRDDDSSHMTGAQYTNLPADEADHALLTDDYPPQSQMRTQDAYSNKYNKSGGYTSQYNRAGVYTSSYNPSSDVDRDAITTVYNPPQHSSESPTRPSESNNEPIRIIRDKSSSSLAATVDDDDDDNDLTKPLPYTVSGNIGNTKPAVPPRPNDSSQE
ncbi:7408_t:CDS:2 [Paraglomus occultum]|uniref:7408_t:CDS:1 n=1 Tax=Paraglomus occultum TaxID=144539 RepID=A0A9N9FBB1_9GLOM|nr:7408_t:CDS:2 [Paraglomus occultum]